MWVFSVIVYCCFVSHVNLILILILQQKHLNKFFNKTKYNFLFKVNFYTSYFNLFNIFVLTLQQYNIGSTFYTSCFCKYSKHYN